MANVGALRFAPHLGLLAPGPGLFHHSAGRDPVDQIAFAADHGFTAVQDNFLQQRDPAEQARIGAALARRGMTMGTFVATLAFDRPTFGCDDPAAVAFVVDSVRAAIAAARRVSGTWLTIIPGLRRAGASLEIQTATIVANLKRCAELAEAAGVVLLVEALNSIDRPGMMLARIGDARDVVTAVGSPACRLMLDVYHVQVETGDLIRTIDRCWDHIGYVQIGDNPGRCEPGTGEINFTTVLAHLRRKGYRGPIDMEHRASRDGIAGETAVLRAYAELARAVDAATNGCL